MIQIAAIQMISGMDVDTNLSTAENLIVDAMDQQPLDLVVLPENFAFMGMHESLKLEIKEQPGNGLLQDFLADTARRNQIYVVGGTIPIASEQDNKVYASTFVYDRNGEVIARYDKLHLFDVTVSDQEKYLESQTIAPGADIVDVKTDVGHLGISVCYDLRFPELYRELVQRGVEIFVIPSAFTAVTGKVHWEILLRARAIENLSYVVAANQGGLHENTRRTYGHSMIVDYWGRVLVEMGEGQGYILHSIDLDALRLQRKLFPVISHRRK